MQNHDFHECICLLGCKCLQLHRISQIRGVNHPVLYDKLGYRPETKQYTFNFFLLSIIWTFSEKKKMLKFEWNKHQAKKTKKMLKFGKIYDFCEKVSWNVIATPLLIFFFLGFILNSIFNMGENAEKIMRFITFNDTMPSILGGGLP